MSNQLKRVGTHRVVLDLPHEVWIKLRNHFKGASDADKILRILELTTDRAEKMVEQAMDKHAKENNKSPIRKFL